MDNKEILLKNIGALRLTLFDEIAFKAINDKEKDLGITQKQFINPDVSLKLANLRSLIIDQIANRFKNQVENVDSTKIEDPETYARSFGVIEGTPLAKQTVDTFNWQELVMENFETALDTIENQGFPEHSTDVNQIIQKYLNSKYPSFLILNFTNENVNEAIEEINAILEDQNVEAHPDLPFTGFSLEEIKEELKHDYQEWRNDGEQLTNIVYDAAYENGININGSYPDETMSIIKSELNNIIAATGDVGLSKLEEILSDNSFIDNIAPDDEGYPLLDNYFESLISSGGMIYQAISSFALNYSYEDIANAIRPSLINELSNPTYDDGVVNSDEAKDILNRLYPGIRILEVDQDVLDDLRMDYGTKEV